MKDSVIDGAMESVRSGNLSRTDLLRMKTNAEARLNENPRIEELLELISKTAVPSLEAEYVFMGYCPGADLSRRKDTEWIAGGFITFEFIESDRQHKQFNGIHPPDKIILKKREEFGETMLIHAYGEVTESAISKSTGLTYHRVNWKIKDEPIIVPLLGCNATVNIRSITQVDEGMTPEFWDWLKQAA